MRKAKMLAAQRAKNKIKQHTPAERLQLRRLKRKNGPSGKRRAERRAALQRKTASVVTIAENILPPDDYPSLDEQGMPTTPQILAEEQS